MQINIYTKTDQTEFLNFHIKIRILAYILQQTKKNLTFFHNKPKKASRMQLQLSYHSHRLKNPTLRAYDPPLDREPVSFMTLSQNFKK